MQSWGQRFTRSLLARFGRVENKPVTLALITTALHFTIDSSTPAQLNSFLMDWEKIKENVVNLVITYGFQVIGALFILVAGALLARWIGNAAGRWLEKQNLELPI